MMGTRSLALAALLATGVATAAAAPASAQTALSACGSLTKGSYRLTKNLTTTGHCLTLLNDFTTIDLNGFVITGDGGSSDYGIRMSGAATSLIGIEIRNGTITSFGTAIYLPYSNGLVIERVRTVRNGVGNIGVGTYLGAYCVLNDNVAAQNDSEGLVAGDGCVASGNAASGNGQSPPTAEALRPLLNGTGLLLGQGATALGNATGDNGNAGIEADDGSTLANNSSRSNARNGIDVGCPSNVLENAASDNGSQNIYLNGAGCGDNFNVAP